MEKQPQYFDIHKPCRSKGFGGVGGLLVLSFMLLCFIAVFIYPDPESKDDYLSLVVVGIGGFGITHLFFRGLCEFIGTVRFINTSNGKIRIEYRLFNIPLSVNRPKVSSVFIQLNPHNNEYEAIAFISPKERMTWIRNREWYPEEPLKDIAKKMKEQFGFRCEEDYWKEEE